MIDKTTIKAFFDLEAEEDRKRWEAMMKLPIKERIRKRKAIQQVFLVRGYLERSPERTLLLKVQARVNLSDFKEGDCMVLHKEEEAFGVRCTLYSFEGDDEMLISVFPLGAPSTWEKYYDVPLVLDKDLVDLRRPVYTPFVEGLPSDEDYWEHSLLNRRPTPCFREMEQCELELERTVADRQLSLTPNQREAVLKSMSAEDYYLIQGPPGTGKSFVLGLVILEELTFFRHNVLVIGPNHLAVNNTLGQLLKLCPSYPNIYKVGQYYNAPDIRVSEEGEEYGITNLPRLFKTSFTPTFEGGTLVGMTPHSLYTSRARGLECDTLIIDEAGQMTVPLALMGMVKAKKIILAGDHKQLPPIIASDRIGEELKVSAFQSLMTAENCTVLDTSFRMCKGICDFVSGLFYDGIVKPWHAEGSGLISDDDPLYDFGTPIVMHHVDDDGWQTSDREAEFITETIAGFLHRGLAASEMAVLTPFRAQAANVRRHIRRHVAIAKDDSELITADTIDKMQGQEREVIIFSLTSGDPGYMTEMADFLYNPNKLNVAFSRAKSKLIIVGNIKRLEEIRPETLRQTLIQA